MRVLVVDDAASNRLVLSAMLKRSGFEALTAGTVDEALRIVRAERPDAVVTDLNMPEMGEGLRLAREVRQLPFGRDIRLALMTGDVIAVQVDADVFDAVLDKPVLAQELIGFLKGG